MWLLIIGDLVHRMPSQTIDCLADEVHKQVRLLLLLEVQPVHLTLFVSPLVEFWCGRSILEPLGDAAVEQEQSVTGTMRDDAERGAPHVLVDLDVCRRAITSDGRLPLFGGVVIDHDVRHGSSNACFAAEKWDDWKLSDNLMIRSIN